MKKWEFLQVVGFGPLAFLVFNACVIYIEETRMS